MATITKTLVCVDSADRKAGGSGSDHNKYYKASFDGSTIYYEYGRIGATCTKGQKAGTRASYDRKVHGLNARRTDNCGCEIDGARFIVLYLKSVKSFKDN